MCLVADAKGLGEFQYVEEEKGKLYGWGCVPTLLLEGERDG